MRATIRIVNLYFWKTFYGPFFTFFFPVFFTFLITELWDLGGQIIPTLVVPGCFVTTILALTLISVPVTINDLRHSILFKSMGTSTIKPWMFLLTFGIYYYLMVLVAIAWQSAWCFVIIPQWHFYVISLFTHANYWEVMYSIFITYTVSLAMGLSFLSFCRRNYQIQLLAICIIIVSCFIGGLALTMALLHWHPSAPPLPAAYYVVFFDPVYYLTSLNYESWFAKADNLGNIIGSSIFDPSAMLYSRASMVNEIAWLFNETEKTLNLFMPVGLLVFFSMISLSTFKWNIS